VEENERLALPLLDVMQFYITNMNLCRLNALTNSLCAEQQKKQGKESKLHDLRIIPFFTQQSSKPHWLRGLASELADAGAFLCLRRIRRP
jgi:hypothetical protein